MPTDQQHVEHERRLDRLEALLRQAQAKTTGGGKAPQGPLIVGEVRFLAVITKPDGWLLCDGTQYLISAQKKLFDAIGNAFGGNGTTNFNVPDLRDRAPVGASASHPRGQAYGTAVGQLPKHQHGGQTAGVISVYDGTEHLDHLHVPYTAGYQYEQATTDPTMQLGGAGAGSWSTNYPAGGDVGISPATGAADRDLNHVHNFATDERGTDGTTNVPPSLAIPAYIFAGG